MKQPCVYILASRRNGTIYTGVTSNLVQRVFQHRQGAVEGFSKKYGCKILVWYEVYDEMSEAIAREKQIKSGSRRKKLTLIEALNPGGANVPPGVEAVFEERLMALTNAIIQNAKPGEKVRKLFDSGGL